MEQDEFLEVLKKDIKSVQRTTIIIGSILTGIVLFIFSSLTQGITIREQDVAAAVIGLLFLIAFLILGLYMLRNGLRRAEDNNFYYAFHTNSSQIVWMYKKIESNRGLYSYELVFCHVNKKRYTISCKNSTQLETLHAAALNFNPQAISSYRLEWESIYKNSPEQFIKRVNDQLKNINNIPFTNSANSNFHFHL